MSGVRPVVPTTDLAAGLSNGGSLRPVRSRVGQSGRAARLSSPEVTGPWKLNVTVNIDGFDTSADSTTFKLTIGCWRRPSSGPIDALFAGLRAPTGTQGSTTSSAFEAWWLPETYPRIDPDVLLAGPGNPDDMSWVQGQGMQFNSDSGEWIGESRSVFSLGDFIDQTDTPAFHPPSGYAPNWWPGGYDTDRSDGTDPYIPASTGHDPLMDWDYPIVAVLWEASASIMTTGVPYPISCGMALRPPGFSAAARIYNDVQQLGFPMGAPSGERGSVAYAVTDTQAYEVGPLSAPAPLHPTGTGGVCFFTFAGYAYADLSVPQENRLILPPGEQQVGHLLR